MKITSEKILKTPLPAVNPWLMAFVVILPTAIEVLDTSIANVVLPYIAGALSVSVDESSWILTCYLVSNAIILPITGWLSDTFGRKNYFLFSIAIFTLSSLMCGLSGSLNELLFFRILQGLGGGGLLPISQSILLESFPEEKRGTGMGIYGMGVILAPVIGPSLGGYIADNYSWNWIFLINVPLGIISIAMVHIFIRKERENHTRGKIGIDYIGIAALSLFVAALQILLDKGETWNWFSSNIILALAIISSLSFVFCIWWELKCKNPVLDLRMFKDSNFAICIAAIFIMGMIFYAITEIIPVFLQTLMGYTAFLSGLVVSIAGIAVLFGMPIAGILSSKMRNPKWMIIGGFLLTILALIRMNNFNLGVTFGYVAEARAIMSMGTSFIFVPLNTAAFFYIAKNKIEYGTGMLNLMRNIGGSIGISLVNTLVTRHDQVHQSNLVQNLSSLNSAYNLRINALREAGLSLEQARLALFDIATEQAQMLSYLDGFKIFIIILIVSIFMIFFLKGAPSVRGKSRVSLH